MTEQVLLKHYAAVGNDIREPQNSRRSSCVTAISLSSNSPNVWMLPTCSEKDGEGQQASPPQSASRSIQPDYCSLEQILVRPTAHPKHKNKWNDSSMALLKVLLMAFSFIFWVAGFVMFTVGIWAKISLQDYLVLSTNNYPNTPLILLGSGAVVLLWGFLGCISAAAEKRCLLRTYGFFQLAVLLAGLAAGLSGLFYRRDIAEGFESGLQNAVASYSEDEEKADALDAIQRALHCCGVHSYHDWLESPWSIEQQTWYHPEHINGSVPSSCCVVRRGCHNSPLLKGAPGIHWNGCFKKVCDFVSDNMFYIATGALGLALLQVVGIILSCLLATRIPQRMPDTVPM
ncbi:tetraspanin-7-like [Spea bombifrons]|uniref:tetraspanin-7-like n=1 Tax=Spea bombifrons TaxID=233779 RepID=UPI002349925F|nr:tetraspanin-7-like [Spea bombifrons]